MPTLLITELRQQGRDPYGHDISIPQMPPVTEQPLTFSATAASNAFNAETRLVMLISDADCRLAFGVAPVAVVTGTVKLFAGIPAFFGVQAGHKVAAVAG